MTNSSSPGGHRPEMTSPEEERRIRLLGEIDGKVTIILANQVDEKTERRVISDRVSSLEKQRYTQAGAAGVIGALLTAIFGHTFKWPF